MTQCQLSWTVGKYPAIHCTNEATYIATTKLLSGEDKQHYFCLSCKETWESMTSHYKFKLIDV